MTWSALALAAGIVVAAALCWWLWERSHRRTWAVPGGHRPDIELPHTQEWELHHNDLSLCSKKARLCLAELQLPHASHHVDLIETGAYENISRRYLALHPGGLLPLLVHRGHPIFESHEQIRYAAAHAPSGAPALVPDEPGARREMELWVERASLVGDDPTQAMAASAGNTAPALTAPLFAAMIRDIPVHRILEGLLFHRLKVRPLVFLVLKARGLERLHRTGPALRLIRSGLRHMAQHLDALEAQLERTGGPWIVGDPYTLADVSWAVLLERLREADSLHVFVGGGRRPAVSDWWERIQKRPAFEAALRAHVHPSVERGLARLRAAKAADPTLRAALEGLG